MIYCRYYFYELLAINKIHGNITTVEGTEPGPQNSNLTMEASKWERMR